MTLSEIDPTTVTKMKTMPMWLVRDTDCYSSQHNNIVRVVGIMTSAITEQTIYADRWKDGLTLCMFATDSVRKTAESVASTRRYCVALSRPEQSVKGD